MKPIVYFCKQISFRSFSETYAQLTFYVICMFQLSLEDLRKVKNFIYSNLGEEVIQLCRGSSGFEICQIFNYFLVSHGSVKKIYNLRRTH